MAKDLWKQALELTAETMQEGMAHISVSQREFKEFLKGFEEDFKTQLPPDDPMQALKAWTVDGRLVLRSAKRLGRVAAASAQQSPHKEIRKKELTDGLMAVKDDCLAALSKSPVRILKKYCARVPTR